MTDSCRARNEARTHWEMIREKNVSKPPKKKAPEGASCGNCARYQPPKCKLKRKPVKPYNICGEWVSNQNPVEVLKDIAKNGGYEIDNISFDAWTKFLEEPIKK